MSSSTPATQGSGNFIVDYFKAFAILRETRMEYWAIQIVNFLDSTIFFAVLTMGPLMLSENFGYSDETAGLVMTVYGSSTTICLFLFGAFTDSLGIRRSFLVAQFGQMIARGAIFLLPFFATSAAVDNAVIWAGFALAAPFVAMVQTTFQAANKRFTTQRSRSAGFNAWYIFMNFGALTAGIVIDGIRLWLKDALGVEIAPNYYVMGLAVGAALINIIVVLAFVRREEQVYGPDEKPEATGEPEKETRRKNMWQIAWEVLQENVFWRFLVLITLLLGVRAVFIHMHLLMPKFWERIIGEGARIGALEMINPAGVIIGLILFIPILRRFTTYGMLTWGAMISALSLFVLAIPATGQPVYLISICALVLLTVGEVIWSPRLTEYTAAIAPEGQEGTYLGLSMVPYFAAKTTVSALSGYMLAYWVPTYEEGPSLVERLDAGTVPFYKTPTMMWLILGVWALSGPIVALLMRGWFTKGAKFDNDGEEAAEAVR
jgi:POT family proton-dependent oligopeptide transporter